MTFADILKNMNIEPEKYLEIARKYAKQKGYDPEKLTISRRANNKLNYDGVNFGAKLYDDYILYKHFYKNPVEADERRNLYLIRSSKIKGNWKSSPYSPNNLSRRILWDE